jgi:hypothetical protein
MLPMRWKSLERLPRNSNGKIDRKALRESFQTEVCDVAAAAERRGGRGGDPGGDRRGNGGSERSGDRADRCVRASGGAVAPGWTRS